jgi:hypothetical protein
MENLAWILGSGKQSILKVVAPGSSTHPWAVGCGPDLRKSLRVGQFLSRWRDRLTGKVPKSSRPVDWNRVYQPRI